MAKPFGTIPGPRWIKTLVDMTPLGNQNFEQIHLVKRAKFKRYGKIYKEKLGPGINLIQIFDPEDVATIFRADGKYPQRPPIPITITANKRDGLPLGLGAMNGEEWYELRRAVQKIMMRPRAAAAFLPAQNAVANEFLQLIIDSLNDKGELENFSQVILKYTMESIGVVCFGQQMGCLKKVIEPGSEADIMFQNSNRMFEAVQKTTFAFPFYMFYRTKLYEQFIHSKGQCDALAAARIQRAMSTLDEGKSGNNACPHFLSTLLTEERLTPQQIVGITTDLFTAGIDSTAYALSFVIYNLSRSKDKQSKLWNEIHSRFGNRTEVTADDIDKLHYLKAVVKESFRLNFPVEGGTTRILSKDVTLSGYQCPAKTIVALNNQTMCQQASYFENPTSFEPERWLKDGSATTAPPPKFVMLPFGYGPRMCIGRRFAEPEIYLALIKILQAFEVTYAGTEEVGMLNRVFTKPDRPIRVKFTPRRL